jgi:serine/threonine protein kinase
LADIKPKNVLLNYEEMPDGSLVSQDVRISDLEDAVVLPPGKNLRGCLCGNQLWRSPESWARARQNTPSDVFSFGILAIYVVLGQMIFLAGFSDEQVSGEDAWWHILRRHVSYFATDEDSFKGLLRHFGVEDEWFDRFAALAADFGPEKPRKPFANWEYVDAGFRDLIVKMTNLDPARRITAREALEHPWFHLTDSGQRVIG